MRRARADSLWLLAAVAFVLAFVAAPLGCMALEIVWTGGRLDLTPLGTILGDEHDRRQLLTTVALGVTGTLIATLLGLGHAWVTFRTDLFAARALGAAGVVPLVLPPILVAMAFSDLFDTRGFAACAALLGLCYAPFVAVLAARGLRAISGEAYEAALVARGRAAAERWLLRAILPEVAAGALFAFAFVISEHGVPEFLTVKGKSWHTYAEGIFAKWTRRATGVDHAALASPIVAALPLVALLAVALLVALRLRGRATIEGDHRPLPMRRLGRLRHVALALPLGYLGCGVVLPLVVMGRWAGGSTNRATGVSLERMLESFRLAVTEASGDLGHTLLVGVAATGVLLLVAAPLAWNAARRWPWIDHLSIAPVAVPAVLLGIGMVRAYNRDLFYGFYDHGAILVAAYAARFLPFGVLTLSAAVRRVPRELEEAALFAGRGQFARAVRIHLPLFAPALGSAGCLAMVLALRELDVAVVLPAGNGTVVRRLSNIVHFGGEEMGGALALLLVLAATVVPLLAVILTGRKLRSLS
ncbi:MAG: iron ABC transporter permease [bacterium]|nr:iron ABC transporter permease [bacterium]